MDANEIICAGATPRAREQMARQMDRAAAAMRDCAEELTRCASDVRAGETVESWAWMLDRPTQAATSAVGALSSAAESFALLRVAAMAGTGGAATANATPTEE